MRGYIFLRILFGVLLLAGIAALGVYVYNAGLVQGIASGSTLSVPEGESIPIPYYYSHWYRPWGFGFLGCIFPLLFIFLLFAATRVLFFHGWQRQGYWNRYRSHHHDGKDIPPMVEEWHRKMHSAESEKGSSAE